MNSKKLTHEERIVFALLLIVCLVAIVLYSYFNSPLAELISTTKQSLPTETKEVIILIR